MTLDRALIELDRHGESIRGVVIVFDEAGMAPTRGSERLLARAAAAGAKVIAIGDPGQLASVQAGGWLAALSRRVGANRLNEVQRQRNKDERRALAALHDHQPELYLRWAQNTGGLRVHHQQAKQRALADWLAAAAVHGAREAVLIARDNELRDRLNQHARAHQREQGRLGVDVAYGPVTVATGDRVICRRNDRGFEVDNGTRGPVRATHHNEIVIETDAGTVRALPAAYVAQHVEHAYCLTGHGMQGGTVEHATVLATPRDLTAGWSYTALSRSRGNTILHIDVSEHTAAATERTELAPAEQRPRADRDEVVAGITERMLVRDDEDLAIDQLPSAMPSAGRVDDTQLHQATVAGRIPQEHGAEQADHRGHGRQLRALRGQLESRVPNAPVCHSSSWPESSRPTSSDRYSPRIATSSPSVSRTARTKTTTTPRRLDARRATAAHRGTPSRRHTTGGPRTASRGAAVPGRTGRSDPRRTRRTRPTHQPARTRRPRPRRSSRTR